MVYGNVWSEFGGLYPLLQIVPIVVAIQFKSILLGIGACVISAFALLLYHFSRISLIGRYFRNPVVTGLTFIYLSASPILGGLSYYYLKQTTWWSILNAGILLILGVLCVFVLRERINEEKR